MFYVFICFLTPPLFVFWSLSLHFDIYMTSLYSIFFRITTLDNLHSSSSTSYRESAPLWREGNIFGALQLQLCSFNVVIDTIDLFFFPVNNFNPLCFRWRQLQLRRRVDTMGSGARVLPAQFYCGECFECCVENVVDFSFERCCFIVSGTWHSRVDANFVICFALRKFSDQNVV